MDKNQKVKELRDQYSTTCNRIDEINRALENEDWREPFPHERRELDRLKESANRLLEEEQALAAELGVDTSLTVRRQFRARPGPRGSGRSRRGLYDPRSKREVRSYVRGERMYEGSDDGPSVGALIAAHVRGAQTEAERRALQSATGASGGYLLREELSDRFIDLFRARSVIDRAGAQMFPLSAEKTSIAKLVSDPAVGWRRESQKVVEGEPTFAQVLLYPRSIAGFIKIPRELAADAANSAQIIESALAAATAAEIDRSALFGSGLAGGSDPEPLGIVNVPLVNVVAVDAALTDYSKLLSGLQALAEDNVDTESGISAAMAPRDFFKLQGLTATDGQPLVAPAAVQAVRMLHSSKFPTDGGGASNESTIILGDYGDLLWGVRDEIEITIADELFLENLEIGIFVTARVDFAVQRPGSFALLTGITP